MSNNFVGLAIIVAIIFIGITGGFKPKEGGGLFSFGIQGTSTISSSNSDYELVQKINDAQRQVDELKKKVEEQEKNKTLSKYRDLVSISYVSRYGDQNSEYVQIRTSGSGTTTVNVTGWTLKSESSGRAVNIPKATKLFFADSPNSEEDIILSANENLYLVTGYSSNGSSFKVNKCSGYLSQFQTFNPSLYTSCPAPRDETLSSIPQTLNNDACFEYIERMPSCRIQTENLPANWSYECTKFIYDKINYPSCINTHKSDKDFYGNEWRVYLKRSERIWKDSREKITLYDNEGKIVSTISY